MQTPLYVKSPICKIPYVQIPPYPNCSIPGTYIPDKPVRRDVALNYTTHSFYDAPIRHTIYQDDFHDNRLNASLIS